MQLYVKKCQRLTATSRAGKKQRRILPYRFQRAHGPGTPWFHTSSHQHYEITNLCCFKPPRLWYLVTTALEKWYRAHEICWFSDKNNDHLLNVKFRFFHILFSYLYSNPKCWILSLTHEQGNCSSIRLRELSRWPSVHAQRFEPGLDGIKGIWVLKCVSPCKTIIRKNYWNAFLKNSLVTAETSGFAHVQILPLVNLTLFSK